MSINIIKLFIYAAYIFYIDCYISIPLKIYNINYFQKISSSTHLEEDDLNLILYKELSLGDPKQNIIFIISPDEYNFYMISEKNNEITNDSYYYDFLKSKTNNIGIDENSIKSNVVFLSEKFYFDYKNINKNLIKEIGVENINLLFYSKKPRFIKNLHLNSNINSYIIFGLKLCPSFDRFEYSLNLIRQLKEKNITQNYKWFINYNTAHENKNQKDYYKLNDINMIIGAEPHEIYQDEYKQKNLKLINSKSKNGYLFWGFYFNKIYYYKDDKKKNEILFELNSNSINNTNSEEYLEADIKHDLIFINSPKIFFDSIINNFFNKLIERKKCFILNEKYSMILCEDIPEINEYIENNFNTIYFRNQDLNYEFELGYQDLFLRYNNKIIFMIITQEKQNSWIFGIPFLKKYLLTYDYDHKVIGFYKRSKKIFKNKAYIINDKLKIIIIFILVIIFGIFGFLISRYIYGDSRKKRLNELQENFQYDEKINDKTKNNINDVNINKNEEKLLIGIEMGKL